MHEYMLTDDERNAFSWITGFYNGFSVRAVSDSSSSSAFTPKTQIYMALPCLCVYSVGNRLATAEFREDLAHFKHYELPLNQLQGRDDWIYLHRTRTARSLDPFQQNAQFSLFCCPFKHKEVKRQDCPVLAPKR